MGESYTGGRTVSRQISSKFDLGSQNDEIWVDSVSDLVPFADEVERGESRWGRYIWVDCVSHLTPFADEAAKG